MKYILFILITFCISVNLNAQAILNGSFEATSSGGCNYNMNNVTYNGLMSNSVAFGAYQSLDIVISGCYIPSVPHGTKAVSIANNPGNNSLGEAISLALSAPLIAGNSYTLSFQALAITSFGPQGNLLIGASTSSAAFGTTVYTANTVNTGWTTFTFAFVAPNNATNITVMPVPGVSSWNAVDNFSIVITPLPTELVHFSAHVNSDNNVNLKWESASEINNDFYTVERSKNGMDWLTIKKVEGAGNSTQLETYQTTDERPITGLSYYRLKQTDFNGEFKYLSIQSINIDNNQSVQIKVYPNPTKNRITLEGDYTEIEEWKVFDILGQAVNVACTLDSIQENKVKLDFNNLENGIYYIQTKTSSTKIVKQ